MNNPKSTEILPLEELSLLVLCGPSGSGKSDFAKRWFRDSEIISLDKCSRLLTDREQFDSHPPQAQALLETMIEHRLHLGRFTVVDAPNLESEWRRRLVQIARHHQVPAYLLIFDTPLQVCLRRKKRDAAHVDSLKITIQHHQVIQAANLSAQEGFRQVAQTSQFTSEGPLPLRYPLPIFHSHNGPFDIIGDLHGCFDELCMLLKRLGYQQQDQSYKHPQGRTLVFLGDLTDRGPDSVKVMRLVLDLHDAGRTFYIPGNHCDKLARYLQGAAVSLNHGLETTVEELEGLPPSERYSLSERFIRLFRQSPPYVMFDNQRLLAAHAGLPKRYHGRLSRRIRSFALYGDITGELDAEGYPIRHDWAQQYDGSPLVVYGHTPVLYPRFVNNTINLDQGCVFGGSLTALRYPEREIVSVPSQRAYWVTKASRPNPSSTPKVAASPPQA